MTCSLVFLVNEAGTGEILNSNKRLARAKFKWSAGRTATSGSTRLEGQAELYPEPAQA